MKNYRDPVIDRMSTYGPSTGTGYLFNQSRSYTPTSYTTRTASYTPTSPTTPSAPAVRPPVKGPSLMEEAKTGILVGGLLGVVGFLLFGDKK